MNKVDRVAVLAGVLLTDCPDSPRIARVLFLDFLLTMPEAGVPDLGSLSLFTQTLYEYFTETNLDCRLNYPVAAGYVRKWKKLWLGARDRAAMLLAVDDPEARGVVFRVDGDRRLVSISGRGINAMPQPNLYVAGCLALDLMKAQGASIVSLEHAVTTSRFTGHPRAYQLRLGGWLWDGVVSGRIPGFAAAAVAAREKVIILPTEIKPQVN